MEQSSYWKCRQPGFLILMLGVIIGEVGRMRIHLKSGISIRASEVHHRGYWGSRKWTGRGHVAWKGVYFWWRLYGLWRCGQKAESPWLVHWPFVIDGLMADLDDDTDDNLCTDLEARRLKQANQGIRWYRPTMMQYTWSVWIWIADISRGSRMTFTYLRRYRLLHLRFSFLKSVSSGIFLDLICSIRFRDIAEVISLSPNVVFFVRKTCKPRLFFVFSTKSNGHDPVAKMSLLVPQVFTQNPSRNRQIRDLPLVHKMYVWYSSLFLLLTRWEVKATL